MPRHSAVQPKRAPLPGEVVCARCAWPKPKSAFPAAQNARGCGYWCDQCHSDYDGRRYQETLAASMERSRAYAAANPEVKRRLSQRRRDRQALSPDRLTPDQELLLRAYFGECVGCGATERDGPLELDHVVPLALAGTTHPLAPLATDGPSNRQLCCPRCNRRKKGKTTDLRPGWRRRRSAAGRDPGPPPFAWPVRPDVPAAPGVAAPRTPSAACL